MSYNTLAEMQEDEALRRRLVACAASEKKVGLSPEYWVSEHIWEIVVTAGWAEAWSEASAEGRENIGAAEDVVTDAMILAALTPMGEPASSQVFDETGPVNSDDTSAP